MRYPATHSDTRARVQLGASFMDDCTIQLADTHVILAIQAPDQSHSNLCCMRTCPHSAVYRKSDLF